MAYTQSTFLHRSLTDAEEAEFRANARRIYTRHTDIPGIWHPVCQDECRIMNTEEPAEVIEG